MSGGVWVEEFYRRLGEQVLLQRTRRGFTQEWLADQLGVTRAAIAALEAGHRHIGAHTLYRLAVALDVDTDRLLPDLDPPEPEIVDAEAQDWTEEEYVVEYRRDGKWTAWVWGERPTMVRMMTAAQLEFPEDDYRLVRVERTCTVEQP